jgi:hypothetical protein
MGLSAVLGAPGEGGANLANDARGAGDGEVDFDYQGASGTLVDQIRGHCIGGGKALVDEDEGELVAAQGCKAGTAAGRYFDLGVKVEAKRIGDGERCGFRSDEQDRWGNGNPPKQETGNRR